MSTLLPGTQVEARSLPWEVVHNEPAGEQHRFRLRCLQSDLQRMEIDPLHPFQRIRPIATDLEPHRPLNESLPEPVKRLVEEGRAVTEGRRRGMKYRRADAAAP